MATIKPNVKIDVGANGRARVSVGGVPMAGVIGVELKRPHKYRNIDGWTVAEPDGPSEWVITVSSRFVNRRGDDGAEAET